MDTNSTLRNGDLLAWIESLDWDERSTYRVPEYQGDERAVHVRIGMADMVVYPQARHKVTGQIIWGITGHTHDDEDDARECYAENRRRNELMEFEATVSPERAQQRAEARAHGIPDEVVDKMIPLIGKAPLDGMIDKIVSQARRTGDLDAAIKQGAREVYVQYTGDDPGPTGFYL